MTGSDTRALRKPHRGKAWTDAERADAVERVCARIEGGSDIVSACGHEEVPRATLYEWLAGFEEHALRFDRARAVAADIERDRLDRLIDTDARTANVQLHKMGVLFPDRFAPPTKRIEQVGAAAPVVIDVTKINRDEMREQARALKARNDAEETEGCRDE